MAVATVALANFSGPNLQFTAKIYPPNSVTVKVASIKKYYIQQSCQDMFNLCKVKRIPWYPTYRANK